MNVTIAALHNGAVYWHDANITPAAELLELATFCVRVLLERSDEILKGPHLQAGVMHAYD